MHLGADGLGVIAMLSLRAGVVAGMVLAGLQFGISSTASAGTVQCYGAVAGFSLTTTPTSACFGSGGPANDINNGSPFPGYTLLDKSDDTTTGVAGWLTAITVPTGNGTPSGTFLITPGTGFNLATLVLAFRDGENHEDGYGAFLLAALSGSWAIINPAQNLSHFSLYGQACPAGGCPGNEVPPAGTPIPGAAGLMGSVIAMGAGFGAWRRRRKNGATA
jgi:hypothetical protein